MKSRVVMKELRRSVKAFGFAALLWGQLGLWSVPALAGSQLWRGPRDPAAAAAATQLLAAERMYGRAIESGRLSAQSAANFERAALAILELAGPSDSGEFNYFHGYLLSSVGPPEKALQVLERALKLEPGSPSARRAWFNVGVQRAKLGDSAGEYTAYTEALRTTWEPELRANIYLNRGESRMVHGELGQAAEDYGSAVQLAREPSLQALAYWGLAIVRERLGDLPASLTAARLANRISPGALELPSVFFVPRYDIYYYRALTWMALAQHDTDPDTRAGSYELAAGAWSSYLSHAKADGPPWMVNARLHYEVCVARQKQAEAEHLRAVAKANQEAAYELPE